MKLAMAIAVSFLGLSATAQSVDNTFSFVDAQGNVIPDGSTITVNELEFIDDGMGGYYQISSGLFVKNNTSETQGVGLELSVSRFDNGSLNVCFPSNCLPYVAKDGTFDSKDNGSNVLEAGESKDFLTEFFPEELGTYGTCTATFQLKVMDVTYFGELAMVGAFKAYGSKVTVNFVYSSSSTGIENISSDGKNTVKGYYSLDGRKLDAPQKGINIIKYSNGKTVKTVVK